jgi:hypothetical protein
MSRTIAQKVSVAAAIAIAAGGFLAVPVAHADTNCTVPGAHLNLHHSSGYDVTVDASGTSLGPGGVVRVTPEQSSDVYVTGSIQGRSIEFRISWSGTKAYVSFTGTVGDDGIAHGTSSGIASPVTLKEGPWDSVEPLACSTP